MQVDWSQQGWPAPPQETKAPAWQTLPAAPLLPEATHSPEVLSKQPPPAQTFPAQAAEPGPPQGEQRLEEQAAWVELQWVPQQL